MRGAWRCLKLCDTRKALEAVDGDFRVSWCKLAVILPMSQVHKGKLEGVCSVLITHQRHDTRHLFPYDPVPYSVTSPVQAQAHANPSGAKCDGRDAATDVLDHVGTGSASPFCYLENLATSMRKRSLTSSHNFSP